MRARATLVAEVDSEGATRLTRIRSEPPLVLRATADGVYLVGAAGGPLGGDEIALDIEVGPGADLTVRSAAASVAQPGPGAGNPSVVRVTAHVAAGGRLRWLPEPTIAARGCRHHMEGTVTLGAGARLAWREEIVLGRHGEPPGSVVSRFTADAGGLPLLRHEVALGPDHPAADGPAVAGSARAVGSVLLVDPAWETCRPAPATLTPTAAVLPLAGPAVQVVALAADAIALRRALDAGVHVAQQTGTLRGSPVTQRGTNPTCSPSS